MDIEPGPVGPGKAKLPFDDLTFLPRNAKNGNAPIFILNRLAKPSIAKILHSDLPLWMRRRRRGGRPGCNRGNRDRADGRNHHQLCLVQ